MHEVECAKQVRQGTAARLKHNPDRGYILFASITPISINGRTTCIRKM